MQTNSKKIYYFIMSIILGCVVTLTSLLVLPITIYKIPTLGIYLFMFVLGVMINHFISTFLIKFSRILDIVFFVFLVVSLMLVPELGRHVGKKADQQEQTSLNQ